MSAPRRGEDALDTGAEAPKEELDEMLWGMEPVPEGERKGQAV